MPITILVRNYLYLISILYRHTDNCVGFVNMIHVKQ